MADSCAIRCLTQIGRMFLLAALLVHAIIDALHRRQRIWEQLEQAEELAEYC